MNSTYKYIAKSMKYQLEVKKICSAHIMVEAEDEQKARDKAEDLKYHFHLAWK